MVDSLRTELLLCFAAMPYLPSKVLEYHAQKLKTSCAASGAEVVLKCHDKLPLDDTSLQTKYGGANIGFEKEVELISRGIIPKNRNAPTLDAVREIEAETKNGRYPLVSLPVELNHQRREIVCHLFVAEPGNNGLRILDPANGSVFVDGTRREVASAIDAQRARFHDPDPVNYQTYKLAISMKTPTPDELEKAIEDIGYAILQACVAHEIYHIEIVPVLRRNGISEESITIINNASVESQLLFLRKLNEFFKPLPGNGEKPLKDDDLRAAHYFGFESSGPFLSDEDEAELHKRVGHITLKEVREQKKDWTKLIRGSVPVAIDRSLEFFRFSRDSDEVSSSMREDARYYIEHLEHIKELLNRQPA